MPRFVVNRNPRDVQRALAIPMLYVTHSVGEAAALGSRLFLLERGKIVVDGPPLDILAAARRSIPPAHCSGGFTCWPRVGRLD